VSVALAAAGLPEDALTAAAPEPIRTLALFDRLSRKYLAWKAGGDADEFDGAVRAPDKVSPELANWYSSYKLHLSPRDIASIRRRFEEAMLRPGDGDFQVMSYIADLTIHRMFRHMRAGGPRIVSIGESCLPRTLSTKWGFKPSRLMGEPTMPFDLAVHAGRAVLKHLQGDFAAYLDMAGVAYRDDLRYPVNEADGVFWNHEVGPEWAQDGFRKFTERYRRRVAAFREAAQAESCLFFFYSENAHRPDLVAALAEAIAKLRGGRPATLFAVNGAHPAFDESEQLIAGVKTRVLLTPRPYPEFVWFQPQHFSSAAGHIWERLLVGRLTELVDAA